MQEIYVLENVVSRCGMFVALAQGSEMEIEEKPDTLGHHFSTRADRGSQERALKFLAREMPGEVVIAEEQDAPKDVPPNCTVLDPLDATTLFYNQLDDFGVTICTLRDGRPAFGATYFPRRLLLISAVRGMGCWVGGFGRGKQIKKPIPWHGQLDKTLIGTDVGTWVTKHKLFSSMLMPLAERFNLLSAMSAIEGQRCVLFGNTGAYYSFGIAKVWDAAAMTLAIEEAGGVVCDPEGKPLKWDKIPCDWIVAANQQLADVVLEWSKNWKGRTA